MRVHSDKIRKVAARLNVNYSSAKKILKQNKYKKGKRFKHSNEYMDLNCPILHEVKQEADGINVPNQCQLFLYQDWESNSMSVFNKNDHKYPYMKTKLKTEVREHLNKWKLRPNANDTYLTKRKYYFFMGSLKNLNNMPEKRMRLLM